MVSIGKCTFTGLIAILTLVSGYDVKLTKRSTLYLPGSYDVNGTGMYGLGDVSVEQISYDFENKILYTVGIDLVHAVDMSNPDNMKVLNHTKIEGFDLTDVEFCGNHVFVSADHRTNKSDGLVIVFNKITNTDTVLQEIMRIHVGHLPDMIKPIEDCSRVIVAVEAEAFEKPANQITDPPGLIVIINFPTGINTDYRVVSLHFNIFDDKVSELSESGVRHVFQENSNPFHNDVEPEFITFNKDQTIAYVSLQENNAIAVVDLIKEEITAIHGLGFKNWSNLYFDPSDRDNGVWMHRYNIMGMYQPDAICHFMFNGQSYIALANEGDAKEYEFGTYSWSEETRAEDIDQNELPAIDEVAADQIREEFLLGRLKLSTSPAMKNSTGHLKALYAFGARSFSIRRADDMSLVYDSGDELALRTLAEEKGLFNSDIDRTGNRPFQDIDGRSDDKGVETESVEVGELDGVTLIFVGNERPGTIFVYSLHDDVTKPVFRYFYTGIQETRTKTWKEQYESRTLSEIDVEDLHFLPASKSPTGKPCLLAAGSVSGTLSILNVEINDDPTVTTETPIFCSSSAIRCNIAVFHLLIIIWILKHL